MSISRWFTSIARSCEPQGSPVDAALHAVPLERRACRSEASRIARRCIDPFDGMQIAEFLRMQKRCDVLRRRDRRKRVNA